MLYMVIEHFREGTAPEIYRRYREKGRMTPDGLEYISSWISHDVKTCWQIMQTENAAFLKQWTKYWDDLIDFEIIPILTSAEAKAMVAEE